MAKTWQEIREGKISSSALKQASISMRKLWYYYNKDKDKKGYFDFGNALELYIINTEAFAKEVAVFDDSEIIKEIGGQRPTSTKAYKEFKADFDEANKDKYIINATGKDSYETIKRLAELFKQHPTAMDLVKGDYQKAFEWICPDTGLKRYARPDVVNEAKEYLTDIKTDATDDFSKTVGNMDYLLQAYDQIQGAIESGIEISAYYWVVFSKSEPLAVDVYGLDVTQLLKVENKHKATLRKIKETETVPPYNKDIITRITPPAWYK